MAGPSTVFQAKCAYASTRAYSSLIFFSSLSSLSLIFHFSLCPLSPPIPQTIIKGTDGGGLFIKVPSSPFFAIHVSSKELEIDLSLPHPLFSLFASPSQSLHTLPLVHSKSACWSKVSLHTRQKEKKKTRKEKEKENKKKIRRLSAFVPHYSFSLIPLPLLLSLPPSLSPFHLSIPLLLLLLLSFSFSYLISSDHQSINQVQYLVIIHPYLWGLKRWVALNGGSFCRSCRLPIYKKRRRKL